MKHVRMAFVALSTGFLGLGYALSQYAAIAGNPTRHAVLMDQPQVKLLSVILLIGAIALAVWPARGEEQ